MDKILYRLKGCTEPGVVVAMSRAELASGVTGFTAATTKSKYGAWARTGVGAGTLTFAAGTGFQGFLVPHLQLIKGTAEDLVLEVVSAATSAGITTITYRLVSAAAMTTPKDPGAAVSIAAIVVAKDTDAI